VNEIGRRGGGGGRMDRQSASESDQSLDGVEEIMMRVKEIV
jgi:hypothetical protein